MAGLRDLGGFIPNIRDRGLGAVLHGYNRVGFCGVSQEGPNLADPFTIFRSPTDVLRYLERGPAVEQLLDLFDDGYDSEEPALSVREVVYREIDVTGGVAASGGTPTLDGTGSATAAVSAALPFNNRTYAVWITAAGDMGGDARYRLCRNYEVIDPNHRVWEEERQFPVTAAGPPQLSRIYLEEPGTGYYVEFTEGAGDDFDLDDVWSWTAACAIPTAANVLAALLALVQYRDDNGLPIGGVDDISMISCDRAVPDTEWADIHQLPTDEWNDNINPTQIVLATELAGTSGSPLAYDIDDWVADLVTAAQNYRITTIPTNSLLNGALVLTAEYGLRKTVVDNSTQLRHQAGAKLGQMCRARAQWDTGWVDRFVFNGLTHVYPWNSREDNMTVQPLVTALEARTALLSNEGHILAAWPRSGYIRKIVTDSTWAMADPLSDYFKAPYFRIIGTLHNLIRAWFAVKTREPGVSSNDAAALESEANAVIIKPNKVDPSAQGDAIKKMLQDGYMSIWAEADVLVTEELMYLLQCIPVGSKHQLTGYSQLVRSIST